MATIACTTLATSGCRTAAPTGRALTVASVFGDNMVLQRNMPVPVWGTADPGEEVTVTFAGGEKTTNVGADGDWKVLLDAMEASVEPRELQVHSPSRATYLAFGNVLVGDVWFCSGQSNMEWALRKTDDGDAVTASARHPLIRLFSVPHRSSGQAESSCGGAWSECTPQSAGGFSGVAYYFGVDLQKHRKIPVGLIHSAWNGACAETWVPEDRLAAHPTLGPLVTRWHEYRRDYPRAVEAYRVALTAWESAGKEGRRPHAPKKPDGPEVSVGRLYNGMLHPVLPYGIRGVLWYQGENNILAVEQYKTLFPFLIREWRQLWGQGDFPFYFVQIAGFGAKPKEPEDSLWAHLREAQLSGLDEPNTGMITAIDIGGSFHPKNKRDVGLRLAALARAGTYEEAAVTASGPRLNDWEIQGYRVVLTFDKPDNGLATRDGKPLLGFSVAGKDRLFVWADARIEGNRVTVWSDKVETPVAVRYAWATNPRGNLVNDEGWPAVPFRTDDWPPTQGL